MGKPRGLAGCGLLLVLGLLGTCCAAPCAVGLGVPAVARGAAALREVDHAADVAPGEWVEVGGANIHIQRWNQGGPKGPLVLVPGTSAWAETWVEIAKPLAAAGYDVIALDLPPFGYSDRPADCVYTRAAQATRINGVITALALKRVALLGHSFGGGATVEAALTAPETIRHLFLLDVALGLGAPPASGTTLIRFTPIAEGLVALTMSNPSFTSTGVGSMVFQQGSVTPVRVERYQRPLSLEGTTSAIAAWLPELLDPTPGLSSDPDNYRTLNMKTTLIWGAEDHATPLDQAEQLNSLLPNSRLAILQGVGHLPQIEDPAAVVRTILASDP